MTREDSLFFIDTARNASDRAQRSGDESPLSVSDSAPAWVDEDDIRATVRLDTAPGVRKMRETRTESAVSGHEYARRLKASAERLVPRPRWASTPDASEDASQASADAKCILQNPFSILARRDARGALAPDVFGVRRLRDVATSAGQRYRGGVAALDFHPSEQWVLSVGADRTLRVHALAEDRIGSTLLCSVRVASFDVFAARFTADGTRVIAVGASPGIVVWELRSGILHVISRLAGCSERSWTGISVGSEYVALHAATATRDRKSHGSSTIAVLSAATHQLAGTLRANGVVSATAFCPRDARTLYSVGADSRLYTWSLDSMRCVRAQSLQSGTALTSLAVSPDGQNLAVGSALGVLDLFSASELAAGDVRPLASLMNLTTAVTSVAFHPFGEMLVYASDARDNALRVVHLSTLRVFPGWPKQTTPVGRARVVAFDPTGRLLSVGNVKGTALLYSLTHYDRSA